MGEHRPGTRMARCVHYLIATISVGGPCQLVSCCSGSNQNAAKHPSIASGSRYRFHPPHSELLGVVVVWVQSSGPCRVRPSVEESGRRREKRGRMDGINARNLINLEYAKTRVHTYAKEVKYQRREGMDSQAQSTQPVCRESSTIHEREYVRDSDVR